MIYSNMLIVWFRNHMWYVVVNSTHHANPSVCRFICYESTILYKNYNWTWSVCDHVSVCVWCLAWSIRVCVSLRKTSKQQKVVLSLWYIFVIASDGSHQFVLRILVNLFPFLRGIACVSWHSVTNNRYAQTHLEQLARETLHFCALVVSNLKKDAWAFLS